MAERAFADIGLRDLHVLGVLLRERNLTRAADLLGTSQPAVSKVLARLRTQFDDRLLVRAGRSMQPTRRALELAEPLRDLLSSFEAMNRSTAPFAPESSDREFRLLMTDVGMIVFLPRLTEQIRRAGAGLRISAMPFDKRSFASLLESGHADLAIGDMPDAAGGLRRQTLYTDRYLSVIRKSHPDRAALAQGHGFLAARHILVQASDTGHAAHAGLARALEAALLPAQVQLRLPSFMAGAAVAKHADPLEGLPRRDGPQRPGHPDGSHCPHARRSGASCWPSGRSYRARPLAYLASARAHHADLTQAAAELDQVGIPDGAALVRQVRDANNQTPEADKATIFNAGLAGLPLEHKARVRAMVTKAQLEHGKPKS